MDYTQANGFVADPTTGFRKHLQAQAVPTQVTDQDMNALLWSNMEVLKAAGLSGQQFDPTIPASYSKLATALKRLTHSHVLGLGAGTHNLTAEMGGMINLDATAGNVIVNLPLANASAPANISQWFHFFRSDNTANTVTINRAGADLIDNAATSFELAGVGQFRALAGYGAGQRWFTLTTNSNHLIKIADIDLTGVSAANIQLPPHFREFIFYGSEIRPGVDGAELNFQLLNNSTPIGGASDYLKQFTLTDSTPTTLSTGAVASNNGSIFGSMLGLSPFVENGKFTMNLGNLYNIAARVIMQVEGVYQQATTGKLTIIHYHNQYSGGTSGLAAARTGIRFISGVNFAKGRILVMGIPK